MSRGPVRRASWRWRWPWRARRGWQQLESLGLYGWARLREALSQPPARGRRVEIQIPPYGYTGGSHAIASIAPLLHGLHDVTFVGPPAAALIPYVWHSARLRAQTQAQSQVLISESGTPLDRLLPFSRPPRALIICNHGWPQKDGAAQGPRNYGYSNAQVRLALQLASVSHFVSVAQRDAFVEAGLPFSQAVVIPNFVAGVDKTHWGRRAGVVCDTTLPLKNAQAAIAAANASAASAVHIWGRYTTASAGPKLHWHGFSRDKRAIYNSLDVLVLLSEVETQPLVVLEALSAGIPCVLADIACYQEFRDLPGFWFVPAHDSDVACRAINAALDAAPATRESLRALWRRLYAPQAARQAWAALIERLAAAGAASGPGAD